MGIIGNTRVTSGESTPLVRGSPKSEHHHHHHGTVPSYVQRLYCYGSLFLMIGMTCLVTQQLLSSSTPSSLSSKISTLLVVPPERNYFPSAVSVHTPSNLWGAIKKPYPTGAFWTNLVVDNGDGVAVVLPYGVKCLLTGVQVSYSPTRRVVSNLFVRDTFDVDLEISAEEKYVKHEVASHDEFSVTMKFSFNGGEMRTPLVKGSPFISVIYTSKSGITPVIRSNTMKITAVEVREMSVPATNHWYNPFSGPSLNVNYYVVTLGNFQKWLVLFYSSDESLYSQPFFSWNAEENKLSGRAIPSATTVLVRVSILPTQELENAIQVLLQHGAVYPTGGHSTISEVHSGEVQIDQPAITHIEYHFHTAEVSKESAHQHLLMLALPHHLRVITAPVDGRNALLATSTTCDIAAVSAGGTELDMSMNSIPCLSPIYCMKGRLIPIAGKQWTLTYNSTLVRWIYPLSDTAPITTEHLSVIGQSLVDDVSVTFLEEPHDPYTVGKALARLSMLALIADNLGVILVIVDRFFNIIFFVDTGIAACREKALQEIQSNIMPWLTGTNIDRLLYDTTHGGVVPQQGLMDIQADFGSGLYNDHHFHYGYFLYTGAVLAKLSPAFFTPYQSFFDTLSRDICNPSLQDRFFPFARHKDMYDGHSWASGLFQQANGKNQESSSESVNAYYAVALYADITEQPKLRSFARSMLTMEIQSVQMYWHVSATTHVYDKVFGEALGMVGNVGALGKLPFCLMSKSCESILVTFHLNI